jgi:uncharacterized membrane protein
MAQLWTIIFIALIAIAFSLAAWHDRGEAKRCERRSASEEMLRVKKETGQQIKL